MPNLLYDTTTKNITCIKINSWQQSKEIFEITQSLNISKKITLDVCLFFW